MDGFDISFSFQIFPNKNLEMIKEHTKIREKTLVEMFEKCKVSDQEEATVRLEVSREQGCDAFWTL